jgi:nitrogen-specific signal transduction histidine kinase
MAVASSLGLANAQRLVHGRSALITISNQHAANSLSIMLPVSAAIRVKSGLNIKY